MRVGPTRVWVTPENHLGRAAYPSRPLPPGMPNPKVPRRDQPRAAPPSGCGRHPDPTAPPASCEPLYETLRRRIAAWRAAGASPQILRWIREGARCEWLDQPPPPYDLGVSFTGTSKPSTPAESAFLESEITRMLGLGALRHAPRLEAG